MLKLKTKMLKERKGMTLVELIIYLAITAIVLTVIIDLVARIGQNRSQAMGQQEVTENTRFFSDRLTYAIQQASATSGSGDTLNLTVSGQPIIFTLNNGQIFYQEGAGPQEPLTDENVEISPIALGENIFNQINNTGVISVQAKFKAKFKESNFSRDFQTSALLRGK